MDVFLPREIANDPMGELMQIRSSMPARRGSFWLAVGLRGSSFVIVHVTAVVYVALDRGVEVGIMGVARMALPGDDTALVNIELALKARFSTAEGILSIQAGANPRVIQQKLLTYLPPGQREAASDGKAA